MNGPLHAELKFRENSDADTGHPFELAIFLLPYLNGQRKMLNHWIQFKQLHMPKS